MCLHKLNPGARKSWCGEKYYPDSTGFVRRWGQVTCPECLKYKQYSNYQKYYKSLVPRKAEVAKEPDMVKLRRYWREKDLT